MPFQRPWLLIGVSARIYYPTGPVLDLGGVWTKTLHYLEQSVAHWVMSGGALPVMVPAVDADSIVKRSEIELAHYAEALDGLVLQGGNDLAPEGYGETPLHPDWHGDRVRDRYEMELVQAFMAVRRNRPIERFAAHRDVLAVQPVVRLEMADFAEGDGDRRVFHRGRKCTGANRFVHGPAGPAAT